MQYAGYYNLAMGDKAARQAESRRVSVNTTTSSTTQTKEQKSGFKRFLNALKATEEDITPSGIYSPIIKRGHLFEALRPAEKAQQPAPIYQRERPLFHSSKKRGSQTSVNSGSSLDSQK